MNPGPDQSQSLWQELPRLQFSPLTEDLKCDVCVIGGGITGLSVAYQLLREGRHVVVIDRDHLGTHETGHSSAHLSSALDDGFQHIKKLHGLAGLKIAYESHVKAIDQIESIISKNKIDCEFERVPGFLFRGDGTDQDYLYNELLAVRDAGAEDVELIPRFPKGLFDVGPCLMFPDQAQFHPLKYLHGLAQAIHRKGGLIFTQTAASEIVGGKNAFVKTARGNTIQANALVVATNVPVNDIVTLHTKMAAYRSYVIAVKIPPGWYPQSLLWDTSDPYHYVRMVKKENSDEDFLLVGGADHRTGQKKDPEDCYSELRHWTREKLNVEPIVVAKWSGQIIEPMDSLAYIGKNPGDADNVFVATGDSGHGLTFGTMAGMILRELVQGRPHPWADLYSPSRMSFGGLDAYVEENMNTMAQYGDWFSKGDVETTQDIRPGEGAVFRHGLNKIAAYRDEHGHIHSFSATCPHLKGIVKWNEAEKTWDCPCHGSRFSRMGKCLNGPAISGLTPIEDVQIEQKILIGAPPPPIAAKSLGTEITT
jgi:glycine/D-amino acid oxidase-like deaminating enzyme/nitrite reductase/ring-hydroxylating ferredoxin subunit